jgi:putative ABC transport system ATP-binding protein
MTSPHIVIDAKDVTLALGAGAARVEILRGIDLQVASGESVALLGPSGSGKSSLMAVLSGLERATSGTIRVAGADFTSLNEDGLARARRGRIGIVLQAFHLLPTMTAHENVAVPLELSGEENAFPAAAAELEAVGLGHRLTHYPAQLSGGEQQRVAIARATAPSPNSSSPTSRRETSTRRRAPRSSTSCSRGSGHGLHSPRHHPRPALAARCGRVLEMQDGRIVSDRKAA